MILQCWDRLFKLGQEKYGKKQVPFIGWAVESITSKSLDLPLNDIGWGYAGILVYPIFRHTQILSEHAMESSVKTEWTILVPACWLSEWLNAESATPKPDLYAL